MVSLVHRSILQRMDSGGGSRTAQWGASLHGVLTELLTLRGVPGGITVDYSRDLSQILQTDPKPHSPLEQAEVFLRDAGWHQDLRALRTRGAYGMLLGLLLTLFLVAIVAQDLEFFSAQGWLLLVLAAALIAATFAQPWLAGRSRARMAARLSTAGLYQQWLLCLARGPEFFRELQQQRRPWALTLLGAKPYPAMLRLAVRFMVTGVEWFTPQPQLRQDLELLRILAPFLPIALLMLASNVGFSGLQAPYAWGLFWMLLVSEGCGMLLLWRAEAWTKAADKQRVLLSYLIEHMYAQLSSDALEDGESRLAAEAHEPDGFFA